MLCILIGIGLIQAVIWGTLGSPGRPPIGSEIQQARVLFHIAIQNRTTDEFLTEPMVEFIFSIFDENNDGHVSEKEFSNIWQSKGLGDVSMATFLFHRADTDHSGFITNDPDLTRVFNYFDLNGDGKVNEPEFIITWSSLTH